MRSQGSSRDGTRTTQVKRTKLKEEPRVSGALIRSLVRQLSAARPKEPAVNALPLSGFSSPTSSGKIGEEAHGGAPPHSSPPLSRKQARRRHHSDKPFQQRLLNMAEARREIVAALKLHRAAMNRAGDAELHRLPAFTNPHEAFSSSPANVSQSIKLSPATLSPRSRPRAPAMEAPAPSATAVLHLAMSDEEMALIRAVGEQHDVEWRDRVSMAESTWWCSFLGEKTSGDGVSPPPSEELLGIQEQSTRPVDCDQPW